MGVIASLGHNVKDFWASLLAGKCGIDRISLFDPKDYACQIGAEVRGWDPTQHMDAKEVLALIEETYGLTNTTQAIKDALKEQNAAIVKLANEETLDDAEVAALTARIDKLHTI